MSKHNEEYEFVVPKFFNETKSIYHHLFNSQYKDFQVFIPVFIGDDASFYLLMIFANSNGKPRAQLSIVQGIHDTEHFSFVKTKSVGRLLFIFKMSSNIEWISYIWFYNATIY